MKMIQKMMLYAASLLLHIGCCEGWGDVPFDYSQFRDYVVLPIRLEYIDYEMAVIAVDHSQDYSPEMFSRYGFYLIDSEKGDSTEYYFNGRMGYSGNYLCDYNYDQYDKYNDCWSFNFDRMPSSHAENVYILEGLKENTVYYIRPFFEDAIGQRITNNERESFMTHVHYEPPTIPTAVCELTDKDYEFQYDKYTFDCKFTANIELSENIFAWGIIVEGDCSRNSGSDGEFSIGREFYSQKAPSRTITYNTWVIDLYGNVYEGPEQKFVCDYYSN